MLWPDANYDIASYSYTEYNLEPGEELKCDGTPLIVLRTTKPVLVSILPVDPLDPSIEITTTVFLIWDTPSQSFSVTLVGQEAANITLFHRSLI
ncbi:hypothetical protein D3C86_1362570 [compost metagenome]